MRRLPLITALVAAGVTVMAGTTASAAVKPSLIPGYGGAVPIMATSSQDALSTTLHWLAKRRPSTSRT